MSDSTAIKKLDFGGTLKEGFDLGIKNILPLFVNTLLFGLTCWIPYFGLGVMIGFIGLVPKVSHGEQISYTEVFDPKYRKAIGEFFLTLGMMGMAIVASLFGALAVSYAFSQALYLLVDKGKNTSEAISLSNKCTYGNKLMMFGIQFVIGLIGWIPVLGPAVTTGVNASIYRQLTERV